MGRPGDINVRVMAAAAQSAAEDGAQAYADAQLATKIGYIRDPVWIATAPDVFAIVPVQADGETSVDVITIGNAALEGTVYFQKGTAADPGGFEFDLLGGNTGWFIGFSADAGGTRLMVDQYGTATGWQFAETPYVGPAAGPAHAIFHGGNLSFGAGLDYDPVTGELTATGGAAGATKLDDLTDVDTSTTAPTDGQVLKYDAAAGLWKPGAAAAASAKPVLRGASIAYFNAGSATIAFPAGTVAGDLAILWAAQAWDVNNPANWVVLDNQSGSQTMGATFAKVLTAGDIATGTVTVNFNGGFDGTIAIATIQGSTAKGIRDWRCIRSSNGAASVPIAGPRLDGNDLILGYIHNRANSVDAISNFTAKGAPQGANASGFLGVFAGAIGPLGVVETATFSVGGSGYYTSLVGVRG
jgi:hypothetical protein